MSAPRVGFALLALSCLLTVGCSARETPSDSAPSSAETSAATPANALVITVRIADGSVDPTGAVLDAKAGGPIEVVVDSDARDELHVHGTPEHSFAIVPGAGQRFRFTIDVPGRVDLELHEAGRTVATLLVR
ncbi:hypothetical protein [Nocardia sp. NPDC057668]|uniref:hypothetical protein n=1 Tax=Nocardia sp. NPDC057668 TaxID=3346202 RepID=UPI00366A79E5